MVEPDKSDESESSLRYDGGPVEAASIMACDTVPRTHRTQQLL